MKRILIIEDDQDIAFIERDYLEMNGFETEIAEDGDKGIKCAMGGSFDLILLDLMLPGTDGFSVCRQLRDHLNIPILMVTAKVEDVDKIRGLGIGADDYIVKPFSPMELVARVQSHLARYERLTGNEIEKKSREEQEITVGFIRLNPKSHRVFVKNEELQLKNKEYELLLFLVTNGDIVFSKETLYERIWGYDAFGDLTTVAVHINRLREKIEEDPKDPQYIQTVWGAGYRFKT